jgi:hypothetical protein
MDVVMPYRVPATAPLGVSGRLRLAVEIMTAYVPAWHRLRTAELTEMIRAARDVRPLPALRPAADEEHQIAVRLGGTVVRMLSVLPTDKRCLVRSIVLARLLARRQIPHVLVIGVRPGREFAAHAWLEHDGLALLPKGRFERLLEL